MRKQDGFTAVELLITLFVAAAFLIAAYQLFNVVIKDGGQARSEARAGNVAYDYLRRYAGNATNPCTAQTPLTNSSLNVDGLSNVTITISITCPANSATSLSKVEATITYNTPAQTLKFSTLTNGSSAATSDITEGLIAWWKMNGNGDTSVGSNNGTVFNALPTFGQNGLANNSYSFNASNAYINVSSGFADFSGGLTLSVWAYPTTTGSWARFFDFGNGAGANQILFTRNGTSQNVSYINDNGVTASASNMLVNGSWSHYAVTHTTTGTVTFYRNGTSVGTGSGSLPTNITRSTNYIGRSYSASDAYYGGAIDDARVYNRALSAGEISSLFSGGAK